MTTPRQQPPRETWRVEMVEQETRNGLVHFEYVIRENNLEPFLLNNHKAQFRENHQRIVRGPNGGLMHVSGVEVLDIEEFMLDSRYHNWVDKDRSGRWRDDQGRVLRPYLFDQAPWVPNPGEDELDPQWERERFTLSIDEQREAAIDRYQRRAERKRYVGDKRGTTLNLQTALSLGDTYTLAPVGSNPRTAASSIQNTATFLSFGTDNTGSGNRRSMAAFFSGFSLPQGATIDSAEGILTGQFGETAAIQSVIEGHDSDNPLIPNDTATWNSFSLTTASVTWDFSDTWTNNSEFATPDISPVIQEIVDRASYGEDQLSYFIFDDLNTDSNQRRSPYSYDGSTSKAPKLDIDYTEGGAGTEYEQNVSGILGALTGSAVFRTNKALTGTISVFSGVTIKSTSVNRSGVLGALTGVTTKLTSLSPSGVLGALTGALTASPIFPISLSGTLGAVTGALSRLPNKALSGTLEGGTGSLSKHTSYNLAGVMGGMTGALTAVKTFLISLSGTLGAFTGVLTKQTNKPLSGTAGDFSGSIVKQTLKSLTGVQGAFTGVLSRLISINLSGNLGHYLITSQVNSSSDDALETSAGSVSITTTEPISDAVDEWFGWRFTELDIPNGATILYAYMSLSIRDGTFDEPKHTFYAEDSDDASTFTTGANDISSRPRTTATALWDVSDLGVVSAGERKETVDLTPLVQEVVDRPGWANNNAMVLVAHGDADANRDLGVRQWDFAPGDSAILYVGYGTDMSGTLATAITFVASLAGTLGALTGVLSRSTNKSLSGVLGACTGAVTKLTTHSFAGTMGDLTGSLSRVTGKALTGILGDLTGAVTFAYIWGKTVTGTLGSMTSTLSFAVSKNVSGTLGNITGGLSKLTYISLAGVLGAMTGALTPTWIYLIALGGTLGDLTGSIAKLPNKVLSGSLSPTGILTTLADVTLYIPFFKIKSGVQRTIGKISSGRIF